MDKVLEIQEEIASLKKQIEFQKQKIKNYQLSVSKKSNLESKRITGKRPLYPVQRITQFAKKNCKKFYYMNRVVLNNMDFIPNLNDTRLSLASNRNRETGKLVDNIDDFPSTLNYKGHVYIKTVRGDYTLESTTSFERAQMYPSIECSFYSQTGVCARFNCKFQHSPDKVAICHHMLKTPARTCYKSSCTYNHTPTQFNSPSCIFFQSNSCRNPYCIFTHKLENPDSPICRPFAYLGYCENGLDCTYRHTFECPNLEEYGKCFKESTCNCTHKNKPSSKMGNLDNSKVINIIYDDSVDTENISEVHQDSDNEDDVEFILDDKDLPDSQKNFIPLTDS